MRTANRAVLGVLAFVVGWFSVGTVLLKILNGVELGLWDFPIFVFGPVLSGAAAAYMTLFRAKRGFWPWDRKRHKIALYGHLVGGDGSDRPNY